MDRPRAMGRDPLSSTAIPKPTPLRAGGAQPSATTPRPARRLFGGVGPILPGGFARTRCLPSKGSTPARVILPSVGSRWRTHLVVRPGRADSSRTAWDPESPTGPPTHAQAGRADLRDHRGPIESLPYYRTRGLGRSPDHGAKSLSRFEVNQPSKLQDNDSRRKWFLQ